MDICHAIGNMAKGQPYLNLREILCENLEVDLDLVESFWSAIFLTNYKVVSFYKGQIKVVLAPLLDRGRVPIWKLRQYLYTPKGP